MVFFKVSGVAFCTRIHLSIWKNAANGRGMKIIQFENKVDHFLDTMYKEGVKCKYVYHPKFNEQLNIIKIKWYNLGNFKIKLGSFLIRCLRGAALRSYVATCGFNEHGPI